MQSNGNFELLRALKATVELASGENIVIKNGVVSTVHIPHFGDVMLDDDKLLTELLDEKYSIVRDVAIEANSIMLNLGTVGGLQVPTEEHQAANKKYVDDTLEYFWEQLQNFNYLSFKGMYNPDLTYKVGDLVLNNENNAYYFYLSLKALNNSPLSDTTAWAKLNATLSGDFVTQDQMRQALLLLDAKTQKVIGDNVEVLNQKINDNYAEFVQLRQLVNELQLEVQSNSHLVVDLANRFNELDYDKYYWLRARYDGASIYFYLTDRNNKNINGDISITYNFQNGYMDNGGSFNTVNNRTITATNKSYLYLSSYPARNDYYAAYEYILVNAQVSINGVTYYASWNNFWITYNGRAQFPGKSVTFNIPLLKGPY